MTDERLLRPDQVGRLLEVSASHVRRLWRERKILGIKLSPRRLRFRRADVEEYMKKINEEMD